MAHVSTYLNFAGNTEAAFLFYKSVFQTEFTGPIVRMGTAPMPPDAPPMADADKQLVMHVALPITGGHILMGTDAVESMGHKLDQGNHVSIVLDVDSRAEADALYAKLSAGGKTTMPMQDMFWGAYWGSCTDKFGMQWMVNVEGKK